MDISRDMERTNFLFTKSVSTYERYICVEKMTARLKYVMGRVKTIPLFVIGLDSVKIGVAYYDSVIHINGTR